ncbi:MAG TPA: pitrilysin family protein [Nitrospirota bacterium]|nr:pitrilysin family protein [Nitrospirota bacterium]
MNKRCFAAYIVLMAVAALLGAPGQAAAANGNVLRATLANGMRVVIVENALAPVVTTEMNYLVGSNEAPDGFPGMAHAQEHMMFRGSPGLTAAQLSNITALMGGEFNADTQQTVTQYFFTVPKEALDIALNIEAARMRAVLDTQELWALERGAIEQEVAQDLSSPDYILFTRILEYLFAGTPYAHDALGTRESFQKTTGAMLKRFHDDWYAPNNAVLVIAGDVDPRAALAKVRELFEPVPRRVLPRRPAVGLQPVKPPAAPLELETDMPYGLAVVAYRLPGSDDPDFAAGQILADVLDSRRGDLYALVPRGKALFTGFEGGALPKASYGYAVAAFPPGSDGAGLLADLKKIMDAYMKNGVPADLVEASKRHETADAEFAMNSVEGLASVWSQAVAVEGRSSPEDDVSAIRRVTVEDVNRAARKYLRPETAVAAVLTPKPSGKAVAAKGFGGKESFAPNDAKPVELPAWASTAKNLPPVPRSRVQPVVSTLSNGITLIVQPENVSSTVTVIGQVKNNDDLEEPAGKEGVSDLLSSLFSYGTVSFDRIAFQKAQDDIAADIGAGTSFSLKVLAGNFDRGMELLSDNLLRPALPPAAFDVARSELAGSLKGQVQSPAYLSRRALREALYPRHDPILRDALPETVEKLTLEDVKSYYAKAFRPDMTTIVIIGSMNPDAARRTVEKYFGAWKASGPKPPTDLPAVPPNKPSASTVPDTSRVQDEVTLAQTVGVTRNDPDYYKLQLGNHVLSGAFYATRLYRDLRENAGLVYSVESFIEARKNRSLFGVVYACDPPNVGKARDLVLKNLRRMQTAPVTDEELRLAKTLLVRRVTLAEASIDGIAGALLSRSLEDLPLDEPVLAARQYLGISAEEVRQAFAKWIRPDDFVQVAVGPSPD